MKKKFFYFLAIIAALISVSPMAIAVEFGPNSAKITNRYFPLTIGGWSYMLGRGTSIGSVIYYNVVGIEEVSGAKIETQTFNKVKCLKVNMIWTNLNDEDDFYSLWIAQDTQGNLWVMQVYSFFGGETILLGSDFKSMFMPAEPKIKDRASIYIPETNTEYCEVVAVDQSIYTNFGSYKGCIKTHCYDFETTMVEYYCPDVGEVRTSTVGNPQDIMDLKEYGSAKTTRAVVIPMGN